MTHHAIRLSIIIPVFNEEDQIRFALESALFQQTEFAFEVIVVDDGSTDGTATVIEEYKREFSNLIVIRHERNRGKGAAVSEAYSKARGEYFHILDGDDYFISYDKVQKQVEALDANPHVFAVAHNSVVLHPDKTLEILGGKFKAGTEHSYSDCMNLNFYHHTSSYMIRKLATDLPEEFATIRALRGDSACVYYHAFVSKLGVKYLPDIFSLYDFHGQGIWSGLTLEDRSVLRKEIFEALQVFLVKDCRSFEHVLLDTKLEKQRAKEMGAKLGKPSRKKKLPVALGESLGKRLSLETVLKTCRKVAAKIYQPEIREQLFRGVHGLRVIDQLCEAVGRILMIQSEYQLLNRAFDKKTVALLVSGLQPTGGGIFAEITDLIDIHINAGSKVLIVVSGQAPVDMDRIANLLENPSIEFCFASGESFTERLQMILDVLYKAAPYRLYPFISHHDVISCAAVQKGLADEIVLDYVYDHGSSLGLFNSSIDRIIFRSAAQRDAIAGLVPKSKFLVVPPLFRSRFDENPYRPLRNGSLTTACAAARPYKIELESEFEYCEVIADVLKMTDGQHFHFGPLTEPYLKRITKELTSRSINPSKFVHIPFAENFSTALNDAGIDLFFTPFPVASARIGIEIMSCGIPMVCYRPKVTTLFEAFDFCDPNQWLWSIPKEIVSIIKSATPEILLSKSLSARRHFDMHHDFYNNRSKILTLSGENIPINAEPRFRMTDIIDDKLYDTNEIREMIGLSQGRAPQKGKRKSKKSLKNFLQKRVSLKVSSLLMGEVQRIGRLLRIT